MIIAYTDIFGDNLATDDFKRLILSHEHSTVSLDDQTHVDCFSFQLEGLSRRVQKIAWLIFKACITIGIYFCFSSYRTQWSCWMNNKTFIKIEISNGSELLTSCLESFFYENKQFRQVAKIINKFYSILEYPKTISLGFNELESLQLKTFPEKILQDSYVISLKLCGHLLKTLPDNFSTMTQLQKIDLSGNQFGYIPQCLYNFPETCTINFEGNPLTEKERRKAVKKFSLPTYTGPKIIL